MCVMHILMSRIVEVKMELHETVSNVILTASMLLYSLLVAEEEEPEDKQEGKIRKIWCLLETIARMAS